MAPLAKLATVALMIASGAVAAPWDSTSRHMTHRVRSVGPQKAQFQSYHPPSTFETFGQGVDHPLTKRGIRDASTLEAAKAFLESKLGVSADALSHKSGSTSDITEHEYFRQQLNGIPIANAVANVALKNNKVVSYGASFVKPKSVASATPTLTKEQAITKAEAATGGSITNGLPLLSPTSGMKHLSMPAPEKFVNIVSFVADASYRVVPFTSQSPDDGFSTVTDPQDTVSSPNGWHQYGTTSTTSTSGNNVISYKSSTSGTTSQSSATNNYNYVFNSAVSPSTSPNVDAARVNAFYVANMIHDVTYRYGFDETSYNFQQNNNGKGGAQNDRVQISVQDSSGTNNANFATPADGQPGQMRMYTWTYTTPNRDGALENDIVTHEYTHGISNRLTGGGTGRCLQTTEAGGMGEGWSDAFADWTEQTSATDKDFTLGSYVIKNAAGIRSYPYSTSKTTNPLTYGSLRTLNEVHDIGEVWALIWHEVYAALIKKSGFSASKNDPTGTAGNIVALHLFIDSLKLQPCNPTFISARDAIIQADANRYAGANKCTLWAAFAKRGLGSGATTTKADSTTVPSGC
ncbi:Fungalysin metallopeptidase (M36) [Rhizoctonia solani]|uniref:Extracellular metalloproteinase n=1 Tax=Rhizoctonia solani TaxID=456999 RepID=A0A8H7IDH0_9AGAM|nr:Fungalysin metallopeptidase (M36) [Rhizoctonia solani]